jgi:hypothetical protein
MAETVIVTETVNNVIVSSPGPQGVRGRTILNGSGAPASNLGMEGDFYYDTVSTRFYGPKLTSNSWSGVTNYILNNPPTQYSAVHSWELGQVTGPVDGVYSVVVIHNLGFSPNVTVKSSAGDILETGIDYNSINQLTLTMAQPFSGTAYLS